MPLYVYRCDDKHEFEETSSVVDRHVAKPCPVCGKLAGKVLCPVRFALTQYPYWSPSLGRMVNSDDDVRGGFDSVKRKNEEELR